jgi:uncharacterized membrane protein YjjP (DUF1212 family)
MSAPDIQFALQEIRNWSLSLMAVVAMVAVPALLGGPAWLAWPVTITAGGLILALLFITSRRVERRAQRVRVRIR